MTLSIITVTHNSARDIPRYVETFLSSGSGRKGGAVEFIIVENSGHPEIEDLFQPLKDAGFPVRVVEAENRGFGPACNAGAAIANGSTLIFANPDIEFLEAIDPIDHASPPHLWGTVRQIDSKGRAYAFDVLPEYKTVIGSLRGWYSSLTPHNKKWIGRIFPVGSFYIISKLLFSQVGGFNESFFMYYEEAEMSRRVQKLGLRPVYFENISIHHKSFGSSSSFDSTMEYETAGFLNYERVTQVKRLIPVRLQTLMITSLLSKASRKRLACIRRQIKNRDKAPG
ncbi:glycosyltransferase [Sphingomonadaceae bacterium jetA1]|jgi:GT2 family glycosyltransferase|uniref:glycosyltransferase n=1 Tax=Facivitalis istanbulensis TaxID=3075838 RepID=UPI00346CA23E